MKTATFCLFISLVTISLVSCYEFGHKESPRTFVTSDKKDIQKLLVENELDFLKNADVLKVIYWSEDIAGDNYLGPKDLSMYMVFDMSGFSWLSDKTFLEEQKQNIFVGSKINDNIWISKGLYDVALNGSNWRPINKKKIGWVVWEPTAKKLFVFLQTK